MSAVPFIADATGDGKVDSADATALFAHFGETTGASPAHGDFNFDGVVNALDFNLLATTYGQQIAFSGPLTITAGGTYSGAWQSTSADVPVIRVHTADPVIIENSVVQGRGELIVSDLDHTDITVRNTRGYALNPNISGRSPGRFFDSSVFNKADLENNYLQGTSGIVLDSFSGTKTAATTVRVVNNVAANIDGRHSDGAGGFVTYNTRTNKTTKKSEDGFDEVQFFQMGHSTGMSNVEIAWNQVVNDPYQSRVEDNISIYKTSGTSTSPIRIHDNYIQGGYNIKPEQGGTTSDATYSYDWSYTGGGIMLGDGDATTLAADCGYVQAYNNEVVDTSNYGIAITAGHDSSFYNNRILSADILPSGLAIADQNVGAAMWNANNDPSPIWSNNSGHDNQVGWMIGTKRNNAWQGGPSSWTNNTDWPGTITLAVQNGEFGFWRAKLIAGAVVVGPP